MEDDSNKEITDFLKDIIISIENKTIDQNNLKLVGEFLMSYKYQQVSDDNYEYSDILKYVSIGYYIYKIMDN